MKVIQNFTNAFDFNGLTIKDYTAGLADKASFAVIDVAPGVRHGLSWSKRSDKYYYVVDGNLSFTIEGREYDFSRGDFCIVHQGERFDYRNNSGKSAAIVLVHAPHFILEEEVFE